MIVSEKRAMYVGKRDSGWGVGTVTAPDLGVVGHRLSTLQGGLLALVDSDLYQFYMR